MSQYLNAAKNSSYDTENVEHLVDLTMVRAMKKGKISQDKQDEENDKDDTECIEKVIPVMQKNKSEALKYVAGYCVSHLQ